MNEVDDEPLLFWEKPGCEGNRRQKLLLKDQGCNPQVMDMLSYPWTARELQSFFADKPTAEWFNQSAPAVKSGAIKTDQIDEDIALLLMVQNPILIKRPLLKYGALKQAGFNQGQVLDALNITLNPQQDLQSCPMPESEPVCEAST